MSFLLIGIGTEGNLLAPAGIVQRKCAGVIETTSALDRNPNAWSIRLREVVRPAGTGSSP